MTTSPTARPATPAATIEPGLLDLVLHHDELSLGAKTMPVPAEERPCCADGFLLREDADEDDPQTPVAASAARSSARDGNDPDLNDAPPHVTRPGAGIAW